LLKIVTGGRAAIDYLSGLGGYSDRSTYPLPTLMLLDLGLPDLPGFEVLRWARQQPYLGGLLIVVLTSSDHQSDIQRVYELGANSFLTKPGDPAKLNDILRDVLLHWLPAPGG
jgi:CheY-like chemotaxis protein